MVLLCDIVHIDRYMMRPDLSPEITRAGARSARTEHDTVSYELIRVQSWLVRVIPTKVVTTTSDLKLRN